MRKKELLEENSALKKSLTDMEGRIRGLVGSVDKARREVERADEKLIESTERHMAYVARSELVSRILATDAGFYVVSDAEIGMLIRTLDFMENCDEGESLLITEGTYG